MVGWALRKALSAPMDVPAHRVVNRKGELSGRNSFEHPELMEKLLTLEGVKVKDNKVQDFEKTLWKPADYL